jgi:hypothetical protein
MNPRGRWELCELLERVRAVEVLTWYSMVASVNPRLVSVITVRFAPGA